jgi:glycosyltransferase involved in cell wall biosynthesis
MNNLQDETGVILVSVVIPVYNSSHLIKNLFVSLINQTYKNFEVLVCDDGSTDNIESVVDSFRSKLKIKFFKIKNFGGPAAARNIGIENSIGDLIAFVDADDWWDRNKLELSVKAFDENTDLLYHSLRIVKKNTGIFEKKILRGKHLIAPIFNDLILYGNPICNSSVVVRREIIVKAKGISENKNMIAAEDYNAWLRISLITDKFKYLDKPLGYYLVDDGISTKRNMSDPTRTAIQEFNHLLSDHQKLEVESRMSYMSADYHRQKELYEKALILFRRSFFSKNISLKFRSLIQIMLIYLNNYKKIFFKKI